MAEDIAKKDPEVQRKLREEYGITDLSLVACDPWSGVLAALLLQAAALIRTTASSLQRRQLTIDTRRAGLCYMQCTARQCQGA